MSTCELKERHIESTDRSKVAHCFSRRQFGNYSEMITALCGFTIKKTDIKSRNSKHKHCSECENFYRLLH